MHVIFGYFQIDEFLKVKNIQWDKKNEWMKYHPHIQNKKYANDELNTIYVAKEKLSFNKKLAGAGTFDYNEKLILTKKNHLKSQWKLPKIFEPVDITYHPNPWRISKKSEKKYFQSASRGQEFVIKENKKIEKWAINLINNCILS